MFRDGTDTGTGGEPPEGGGDGGVGGPAAGDGGGFDPVAFLARLGVSRVGFADADADEIGEVIVGLAGLVGAVEAVLVDAVVAYGDRGLHRDDGFADLGAWLAHATNVRVGKARELVTVGRRLADLPVLAGLFGAGRLSVDQVAVACRLAKHLPEHRVVDLVERHSIARLDVMAAELGRRAPDTASPDEVAARESLDVRFDPRTGELRGNLRMPGDAGAELLAAVDERVAQLRASGNYTGRSLGQLRSLALRALLHERSHSTRGRRADVSVHVHLADLADLADHRQREAHAWAREHPHHPDSPSGDAHDGSDDWPGTGPHDPGPGPGPGPAPAPGPGPGPDAGGRGGGGGSGDPPDAWVVGAQERIREAQAHEDRQRARERAWLLRRRVRLRAGHEEAWYDPPTEWSAAPTATLYPDGTAPIVAPVATIERLLCDARWRVVIDDAQGNPVGIGYQSREIPLWLFRAMERRDGGCRRPGCQSTKGLNAHHLVAWPAGPTDLDNLVLLCATDHAATHDGHLVITGDPDHELTFHNTITGRRQPSWPAPHP